MGDSPFLDGRDAGSSPQKIFRVLRACSIPGESSLVNSKSACAEHRELLYPSFSPRTNLKTGPVFVSLFLLREAPIVYSLCSRAGGLRSLPLWTTSRVVIPFFAFQCLRYSLLVDSLAHERPFSPSYLFGLVSSSRSRVSFDVLHLPCAGRCFLRKA